MTFDAHLALIADRAAALRTAVAAAPSLDARVPGCPDWTLTGLVEHVGGVQRFWAAAVTAADTSGPPQGDFPAPAADPVAWSAESTRLPLWSAESTRLLLDALQAAGPASPSWAWWASSGTPLTAAAVARHQVQEAAVHARDAQETIGAAEPLPAAVALDGLPEFLSVPLASMGPWPGRPARIAFAASDGPTHVAELNSGSADQPVLTVHGTASDLVLGLYNRIPLDSLRLEGDTGVLKELRSWIAR
jgi:uncharacterized protein (TIGR03083 family)